MAEGDSREVVNLDEGPSIGKSPHLAITEAEVPQYEALMEILKDKHILDTALRSACTIATSAVHQETCGFRQWELQERARYRADHPRKAEDSSKSRQKRYWDDADLGSIGKRPRRSYVTRRHEPGSRRYQAEPAMAAKVPASLHSHLLLWTGVAMGILVRTVVGEA